MSLSILRARRKQFSLLIISITLLLGVVGSTSARPASAAMHGAGNEASATAHEFAAAFEALPAEADRRLELQPLIGSLQQSARSAFPDTFAGLWVGADLAGPVHLLFTRDADAALNALQDEFPTLALAVGGGAAHSEVQLHELLDRVVGERDFLMEQLGVKRSRCSSRRAAEWLGLPVQWCDRPTHSVTRGPVQRQGDCQA